MAEERERRMKREKVRREKDDAIEEEEGRFGGEVVVVACGCGV